MEVLKLGRIPEEKVTGECSRCRSLVRARRDEVTAGVSYKNEEYYHATCPVCGVPMVFQKEDK